MTITLDPELLALGQKISRELTKQGLCEYCKQPTWHGPWTDAQVAEVIADLGCSPEEFADHCDDCFVIHVGKKDVEYAQELVKRPLQLKRPEHLNQLRHLKFIAAGKALQEFRAQHPNDYRQHPDSIPLFQEFLDHAPPEVLAAFDAKAKAMNLMPEARHVNDAGEPVFSTEDIAEKFGISVEQVERDLREKFGAEPETGPIHPLQ